MSISVATSTSSSVLTAAQKKIYEYELVTYVTKSGKGGVPLLSLPLTPDKGIPLTL